MAKKLYALDTSVLLTNANSIYSFGNNDILIPMMVLEEIDKHKKRQDSVGAMARNVIKILDEMRSKGSLKSGVRIDKGYGKIIVSENIGDSWALPEELSKSVPDHIIIQTALNFSSSMNNPKRLVLVTRDINMRVIADSVGVKTEDYDPDKAITSQKEMFKGFSEILIDDEHIDRFYCGEDIHLDEDEYKGMLPNQYVMLISRVNDKRTALGRFISHTTPIRRIRKFDTSTFGFSARNKEQTFAMDLLTDDSIKVVSLIGRAGSGKTLCALAAGLEQTLQNPRHQSGADSQYTKMIVSRPVQPMGRDIGFLPGTLEEKMEPWLAPIRDNLQYLLGNDKMMVQDYLEKGIIEIEALSYIRGRSIANAYIIIDEAQNLTRHELKTIITRVGEGTKIILTGDIEQIDNVYINETSNGLVHAVEKFKSYDVAGHVTLIKGERSEVATLGAKIL
jgi:PhoH-like ATPase